MKIVMRQKRRKSIPVLTYHSLNVHENTYSGNDHIAFERDLELIDRIGKRVIPLARLIDWYEETIPYSEVAGGVVITLDDGSWLDYYDVLHPTCGVTTSMFNLLKAFQGRVSSARHDFHVTSFVITSPDARSELDRRNLVGQGWWGDEWWKSAQASGLMSIECHSWDHNHHTLDNVVQKDNLGGDFWGIDTYQECFIHTIRSNEYIDQIVGCKPQFFAYPWGQASDYFRSKFMNMYEKEHGYRAAFSIDARHVSKNEDKWFLPRYVCGRDWKSPQELIKILA